MARGTRRIAGALSLAVATAAWGGDEATTRAPGPGATVEGEGVVVAGVECPVIRARDGRVFSVTGAPARLGALLDRPVRFRGTVQDSSVCMQGTPLALDEIEEIEEIAPLP